MAWEDLTNAEAWKQAMANLLRKGEDVGTYIAEAPQKAGQAIVNAGQRQSALMNEAFDPTGKTLIRNPQAANQAAMNLFEGPLGFAPMGMTRADVIKQQIEKIAPEEYRGSHTAPNYNVYGAPFHALDQLIPKDVYTAQGKRLYGINDPVIDHDWFMAAMKSKGNPDSLVEIHRAVPKGVKDINIGDWVTPSKKYADWHGENALNGEYDIISKKVKASQLSSEGYPYELGYHE